MKNPKIPLSIFVAVVMVTTLAFYASFPWARELTGGRDAWQQIRSLPWRVVWFFRRPPTPSPRRTVVVRRESDNLLFPPGMRPVLEEFVRQRTPSDPNVRIIEVPRSGVNLLALPRSQKEAFDKFMQEGAGSDPNRGTSPVPPPRRQDSHRDSNDSPGDGPAR